MSTRIGSSKNNNNFDDFDFDDLDDSLLEDLLKDDLEVLDGHPAQAPAPAPVVVNSSARPTWTLAQQAFNSNSGSKATGSYQQPRAVLQQKQQQQQQTTLKPGQLTIDALFGKRNGHVPQQQTGQSRNWQQQQQSSLSLIPAKRPVSLSGHLSNDARNEQGNFIKVPRTDIMDRQLLDEIDLIEIDSDCDDLIAQVTPPKPTATSSTYTSLQQQQQQKPSSLTKRSPFTHQKQSPFQAKELVIKNRGDNTLIERLHRMDRNAMSTYIYPLLNGQPARAYQQGAIQRCLFQNTLVALPTGMGKTLIAVVVMANYARWFPDSLSIFLAPTKPLVSQQMKACRGLIRAIMSHACHTQFENDWVVEMNGSTQPKTREKLWSGARFVFSTPQILQNDIKTGILSVDNAKRIVLLVIDEAHRATGRYAYVMAVSQLYNLHHGFDLPMFDPMHPAPSAPFRVMSLTATPGSNMKAVNEIVAKLHVSHIFIRTEESMDVVPYIHGRLVEEMVVELPPWLVAARTTLAGVIRRSANLLSNVCKAMSMPSDLMRLSGYQVRMDRDRFCSHMRGSNGGMDTPRIIGEFTILISLAHIMQLLSEHGLRPAWAAINQWDQEVKRAKENKGSSTRAKVDCVDSKEWATMFRDFKQLVDALDGKPPAASSAGAASNIATGTTKAEPTRSVAGSVRTDVVSSFFNMSNKPPQSNSAHAPVTLGALQTPVSLAHSGFLGHPKLERLLEIVQTHFEKLSTNSTGAESTRIIVFSQYRGSVSEIVSVLNRMRPQVKCEPFIGQSKTAGSGGSSAPNRRASGEGSTTRGRWNGQRGAGRGNWRFSNRGRGRGGGGGGRGGGFGQQSADDATGDIDEELMDIDGIDSASRGQTQKEQLAVLDRFRQGATNVIVATCVGEEGLDIGEVDLIINYDAPSSPIRLLQRIGRTGRARRGKVVVFLAKDTREENSYKKAQREYKSVQSKISSGKELLLRTDVSPPMLPPALPHGQPERREIHLTKDDITRGDEAAAAATVAASGKRGRAKKGSDVHSVGIGPQELEEFWRLTTKYDSLGSNGTGCGGFQSAVSIVDQVQAREEQTVGNKESGTVARLLRRGLAWQSLETPYARFSHSKRSVMFRRVMAAIEQARFSHELGADGCTIASGESLFRFEAEPRPSFIYSAATSSTANKDLVKPIKSRPLYVSKKPVAVKEPAHSKATGAGNLLDFSDDEDDSDLQDIGKVLGGRGADTAAKGKESADLLDGGFIDSSPLQDEFLFSKASPAKGSGSCRLGGKPAYSKAEQSNNIGDSLANPVSKRRPSGQGNLFDAIDKLIRSGKAKRTFGWSMDTVDHKLLDQAKARGAEIELCAVASNSESVDACEGDHQGPRRPRAFANIGQPGTFEKLYDKKMVHSSPVQPRHSPSLTSELSDFDMPSCIDRATRSATTANVDTAALGQHLCADSDAEEALQEDILAEASGWDGCSFTDMQVCSPPTQPIPESPPVHDEELMDAFPRANSDQSQKYAYFQKHIFAEPDALQVHVIDDDDALDDALLNFDVDCEKILVLTDDEVDHKAIGETPDSACPDLVRTPAEDMGKMSLASMTHNKVLGNSAGATLDQDLMSSSPPLMPRFRVPAHPRNASASVEMRSPQRLPEHDDRSSPFSPPVRRTAMRLLRGLPKSNADASKQETESISGTESTAPAPTTPAAAQKTEKKRKKLRRPPAPFRQKRVPNMFIDGEADIGHSDDDEDDDENGKRNGRKRAPEISDDERDDEEMDRDLSSFIVDDDEMEFDTPLTGAAHGRSRDTDTNTEVTPRRLGDIYRRSLNDEDGTPVAELMRRLAEREKKRRWVDDTPTKGRYRPISAGPGAYDNSLRSGKAANGNYIDDSDSDQDSGSASSEFESVEKMFS
ncbi:3'-5' DNA helicase [Coemansia sp. RSA 485]|nr:3'-5' DNA helicase [Coemansia sp. RSA 485]